MRRLAPALIAVLAAAPAGCGGSDAPPAPATAATPAPVTTATPAPAATPAPPVRPAGRYLVAEVLAPTALRVRPGGRPVGRAGRRTEYGSPRYLAVVHRRRGWLAVAVPERPNGALAWVPERRTRLIGTDLSLHVDLSARRLTVRRRDRALRAFAVGVGRLGNETPTGRFAVTDKLRMPGLTYGCCALALSGHQPAVPQGWTGGDRIAIHGTPRPETIGGAASLGCLRAADDDLRYLLRTLPLGAPVFIRR